jgi:prevent-host-death family protein
MTDISISQARADLADTIRRARKNPIRITSHGEAQVVLLDASTYEKMLEDLEELEDIAAYDEAMEDSSTGIPWDQVKKDLGLK